MQAVDIKDGASFQKWLEARPEEHRASDARAILYRAALRVFPFLMEDLTSHSPPKEIRTHNLMVLRAFTLFEAYLDNPEKSDEVAVLIGQLASHWRYSGEPESDALFYLYQLMRFFTEVDEQDPSAEVLFGLSEVYFQRQSEKQLFLRAIITDALHVEHRRFFFSTPLWRVEDYNPARKNFSRLNIEPPVSYLDAWGLISGYLIGFPDTYFWKTWYEARLEGSWGDIFLPQIYARIFLGIARFPNEVWEDDNEALALRIDSVKQIEFSTRVAISERDSAERAVTIEAQKERIKILETEAETQRKLSQEHAKQLESQTTALKDMSEQITKTLETTRAQTESFERQLAEATEKAKAEAIETAQKLEADLRAIVVSFREEQAQKAPADLWAAREKSHGKNAIWAFWLFMLGLALVLGFAGLAVSLMLTPSPAMTALFAPIGCDLTTGANCAGFSARGTLVLGMALAALTVLLWFARLRMKIYLSERHLMLESAERGAFAKTYLGLLENGDTSQEAQEQRAIVYAALFRPSSDGMVRDEGGLDPSLVAAISKFLSKSA